LARIKYAKGSPESHKVYDSEKRKEVPMFKIKNATGQVGILDGNGWTNIGAFAAPMSTRQGFLTPAEKEARAAKKRNYLRNKSARAEENRNRSLNGGKKGK
jgi:hypothetical protein